MKRDPYSLIRSIMARQVGATIIKPLPVSIPRRAILIDSRAKRVKLLIT